MASMLSGGLTSGLGLGFNLYGNYLAGEEELRKSRFGAEEDRRTAREIERKGQEGIYDLTVASKFAVGASRSRTAGAGVRVGKGSSLLRGKRIRANAERQKSLLSSDIDFAAMKLRRQANERLRRGQSAANAYFLSSMGSIASFG